jgi:hypothetical protein
MRKGISSALAAIVLVCVATLALPAAATTASQADKLCKANPNCTGSFTSGSWFGCVTPSVGPKSCVACPPKGDCSAAKTSGGRGGSVIGILQPLGGGARRR